MNQTLQHLCSDKWCEGKDSYTMRARCANCQLEFLIELTTGHPIPYKGPTCPYCFNKKWCNWKVPESVKEAQPQRTSFSVDEVDAIETAVARYLKSLGCANWGESFDLISADRFSAAVSFLTEAVKGVLKQ